MPVLHIISEDVLIQAIGEFSRGNHWVAYNTASYYLDRCDVYFFKEKHEAEEFSRNNYSDVDAYQIILARSQDELLRQVTPPLQLTDFNLSSKNIQIMNEKNVSYLKDNIKYMGFGENLHEALEAKLKDGPSDFTLAYKAEVNKKSFEANLHFRKSEHTDMYFFNSYDATLQRNNGDKLSQTFYLNKGKGITAREAYNLLEGRAVHKELLNREGETYHAWVQLDFKNKDKINNYEVNQYHENYGYNLKASLEKYAIAEMTDPDKEKMLMQSLQKGNLQSVSITIDDKTQKFFIEANPQYKTITIYDDQLKRLQKESLTPLQSVKPVEENKEEENKKITEQIDKNKEVKKKIATEKVATTKKSGKKKGMSV